MSFDLEDVGEFINENPQVPLAAGLMAGQAMRRNAQQAQRNADAIKQSLEEIKRQTNQAEKRAARLAEDKNLVFSISRELDALSLENEDPDSALNALSEHACNLKERGITAANFDSFEDKKFAQDLLDRVSYLKSKLTRACAERISRVLDALSLETDDPVSALEVLNEHVRDLQVRGINASNCESLEDKTFVQNLFNRIARLEKVLRCARRREQMLQCLSDINASLSKPASAKSYLQVERLAAVFESQGHKSFQFEDSADQRLVADCEMKLGLAQEKILNDLPPEKIAALCALKDWVSLSSLVDVLQKNGEFILGQKQALADLGPKPAESISIKQVAKQSAFFSVIKVLVVIAAIAGVVAAATAPPSRSGQADLLVLRADGYMYRTASTETDPNLALIVACSAVFFILLGFPYCLILVDKRRRTQKQKLELYKRSSGKMYQDLKELNKKQKYTSRMVRELRGIDPETIKLLLDLEFPSDAASEFRIAAESYCGELRESLEIDDSLVEVLVKSKRITTSPLA